MTSGIYQLTFKNGSTYIGKSCSIARRWEEHRKKLLSGKASRNMQGCYQQYGLPNFEVLQECHPDHIDLLETVLVLTLKPTLNSASTVELDPQDFGLIVDNLNLLQLSTGQHIGMLLQLAEQLEATKTALQHKGTTEHVMELEQANSSALEHARYWQELYQAEKAKKWYHKLFK